MPYRPVPPPPTMRQRAPSPPEFIAAAAPGETVTVPKAPPTGDPGAPVVAVPVKPWWKSLTIWLSGSGAAYFLADALAPVVQEILQADHPPMAWWPIAQRAGMALVLAYLTWRRTHDNTVIGSGSPPGEAG